MSYCYDLFKKKFWTHRKILFVVQNLTTRIYFYGCLRYFTLLFIVLLLWFHFKNILNTQEKFISCSEFNNLDILLRLFTLRCVDIYCLIVTISLKKHFLTHKKTLSFFQNVTTWICTHIVLEKHNYMNIILLNIHNHVFKRSFQMRSTSISAI